MERFDYFIAVDWSARNKLSPKKPSKDAIWLAECKVEPEQRTRTKYFRGRAACENYLVKRLVRLIGEGKRVLVGWDFALGYPEGFASALGVKKKKKWKAVWKFLCKRIEDREDNSNNRFTVAARINQRLSVSGGPFWGVTSGQSGIFLGPKLDFSYPVISRRVRLNERRAVEERVKRAQPVWKLAYTGSVGSQTLLGIPKVCHLRFQEERLKTRSWVWPFEEIAASGPGVVHAEIYPSMIPLNGRDPIKDRAQVRAYVSWLARKQDAGELKRMLDRPWGEDRKLDKRVRNEEGWILGVSPED